MNVFVVILAVCTATLEPMLCRGAEPAPSPVFTMANSLKSSKNPAPPVQAKYSTVSLKKPRRIDKLGIEAVGMRITGAGHMLDFRYRVIDPEKAKPLFDKKIKPYLLDQASGARLMVPAPPKIGALRQTPRESKAGQVYFALFANPGSFIKPGNKVTIIYGDYKIENLVVE